MRIAVLRVDLDHTARTHECLGGGGVRAKRTFDMIPSSRATRGRGEESLDPSPPYMVGSTVEASRPALLENVRTPMTGSQGGSKIIDLRPGIYSVTFTMAIDASE